VRAALLVEYGRPLQVEEVTPVTPEDDDVVVRMTASAYCYTDCLNQRGMRGLPRTLPTIVGHAAVGVVEHAGPAVARVREGDPVLVPALAAPEADAALGRARTSASTSWRLPVPSPTGPTAPRSSRGSAPTPS
jgi:D-arabinose 1-dehydrogenase-like Zn-dependent alcohol dehydrogenase